MEHNSAREFYQSQLLSISKKTNSIVKWLSLLSVLRGLSFIAAFIAFFLLYKYDFLNLAIVAALFFILLLLFFAQKYARSEEKLNFEKKLEQINERELQALNSDYSDFKEGSEYINPNHDFSFDMDVFGKGSIFQMLNRAETNTGQRKLAKYLQNLLSSATEISKRQKSVFELRDKTNWRQNFIATAMISSDEKRKTNFSFMQLGLAKLKTDDRKFDDFRIENPELSTIFWKIVLWVLPITSIIFLALTLLSIIPSILYFFYVLFMLGVAGYKLKYINSVHAKIGQQHKILNRYSELLSQIEHSNFKSPYILELKAKLGSQNDSSYKALQSFAKNLKALDNRLNFVFAIASNGLVLWDMQLIRRIEDWQTKYADKFVVWLDVIAEMEFLLSLANFSYNNPKYTFPKIKDEFIYKTKALGHPLIADSKCVTNDFEVLPKSKTFIISGANMAGKSTFLRTLGVNLILAQIGSVVYADSFEFSPIRLITSIKISDSLNENESYFYAELKRLQYIVDENNKQQPLFIIIDEMLRGTNSGDKHKGSDGFLRKLTSGNNINFLATHDIALGKLADEFPNLVKNYCFEAEIIDGELFFDYKLRDGISQNLNATFLMKKMNIIE